MQSWALRQRNDVTRMPEATRSKGLYVAPFADGALVYDLVTETAHRVGPLARRLLTPVGDASHNELLDELDALCDDPSQVETASLLDSVLLELRALELIGRTTPAESRPAWTGSPGSAHRTCVEYRY